MTSTFLSYRLYAANLTQSLQRIAAEPANANDQKYFEANIGKVKNADDFLNNYRLFTYAMKAYGLSDLGNAKALMKQVIESDLSDPNSVANRLNDSRYKDFAKAFNFSTSGAVGSSGQLQTSGQNQDLMSRLNLSASAAATTQTSLSLVTSVKSFESNKGLYAQVLTAYGLDTNAVSQAQVTAALESNLSDPLSFANRPDVGNDTSYAKLRAIAADFNFTSNGSIGDQKLLQSAQSTAATQTAYLSTIPATADATTQAAAQDEGAYYAKKMPTLTSVDQLLADPRLVAYVKTAFGIDTNVTTQQLKSVLTSNLTDAKSAANTFGVDPTNPSTTPTKYQLLASAFSIGTDGTAWDHGSAMSSVNLTATTAAYTTAALAAVGTTDPDAVKAATTAAQTETDYFTATMPTIKSVTGLLADSRLVSYIRTAYNLPAPVVAADGTTSTSGTSLADLANILTSNLLDTTSVANVGGATTRKLDAAFNFASDGLVYSGRQIANASNVTAITTAYNSQAGTSSGAKAVAKTETDYFTSTLPRVKSVDDLLADKRLVAYISKAYNVPANTLSTTLRQVLTSNLLDPKSTANKLGGGYETLAAAFDISSDGSITHTPDQQVQSKTGLSATHTAFLNQAMETEAGAQNDGVRLALYFKRLASTITNPYQILADKALTAVVQTMLGLSTSSSNADIDSQARTITSKLKLTDLQDPAKVDKLVARFAALYDLKNAASSSSSG